MRAGFKLLAMALGAASMLSPAVIAGDSITAWKAAATGGDAEAAIKLGRAYKTGDGAPADAREAERWFEKAARLGNARGENEYGLILIQTGKPGEALPWLRKAVARGDARAKYALATLLFNGVHAPLDIVEARRLMSQAARFGLPAAAEALKIMTQPQALEPAAKSYEIVTIRPPAAPPRPSSATRKALAPPARPPLGNWYVQVGTFEVRANADRLVRSLKQQNQAVKPHTLFDGGLTRVRLGPFASAAQASSFCRSFDRECLPVKHRRNPATS